MFQVNVAGTENLGELARDLRRARNGLRPMLTQELKRSTKEIFQAVEQEVLTGSMAASRVRGATTRFPASVGRGNHVRRPALRGLTWKVSTSAGNPRAEVVWNPQRIVARVRPLFAYLVGQKTRLRHPVMHRSTWVGQRMPNAWAPARKLTDQAQRAARKAIAATADIIAGRK